MSMHKKPLTELEAAGLRVHGLDIGTPSQLSDAFRQGIAYALENRRAQPEPARTGDDMLKLSQLDRALKHEEMLDRSRDRAKYPQPEPAAPAAVMVGLSKEDVSYPCGLFAALIEGNSPYAFYLFQWVPYQTDAKRWRLKMLHDVRSFDGREAHGIWPNGTSCGPFRDDEVEFIRISRKQWGEEWTGPQPAPNVLPPSEPAAPAGGSLPLGHTLPRAYSRELLLDLLTDIPLNARLDYEVAPGHRMNVPIGKIAFEARNEILEEEETCRQLTHALADEVNGQTFMGEPVLPDAAPSVAPEPVGEVYRCHPGGGNRSIGLPA